jgi:hypothetical protein
MLLFCFLGCFLEPANVAFCGVFVVFQEQAGSWLSKDHFAAKWLSIIAQEISPAKRRVIDENSAFRLC